MSFYKIVAAKTEQEAAEKAGFVIGQRATVAFIRSHPNSDGTYSVMPEYAVSETREDALKRMKGRGDA